MSLRHLAAFLPLLAAIACAEQVSDDEVDDAVRTKHCESDPDCSSVHVKSGEGSFCDHDTKRCATLPTDQILCGGGSVAPWYLHACPSGATCPKPKKDAVGQRLYCIPGTPIDAGHTVDASTDSSQVPDGATACKKDVDCPAAKDATKASVCDPNVWACTEVEPTSIACGGGSLAPWFIHVCPDGYECPPFAPGKIGQILRCKAK